MILVFPRYILFSKELPWSDSPQNIFVIYHFLIKRHEGAILLASLRILIDRLKVGFQNIFLCLIESFWYLEFTFLDDVDSIGILSLFVNNCVLDAVQSFDVDGKFG